MSKIKLDDLKAEISNHRQRIDLLQNKKREVNELIYRPSTFESEVRIYRAKENEILLEVRSLAEHLSKIEREASALERDLANESLANREKEWLSITQKELDDNMCNIISEIQQLDKKVESYSNQLVNYESDRNEALATINSVEVLEGELQVLRNEKAILKVDRYVKYEANRVPKTFESKRNEVNTARERAIDAAEELSVINTRIEAIKVTLSNFGQDRKNLEASYYLQLHHKVNLIYRNHVDGLLTSLRRMHAIETLIPHSTKPDLANRLLSRLNSHGLEIPTYKGLTERPEGLQHLFKDLDNEIDELKSEMIAKVDSEL